MRLNKFFTMLYQEDLPMWTTPAYTEMRFGFEVTMYICNR
jgi:pyrroloquinoline quinone biosynthesis protein A